MNRTTLYVIGAVAVLGGIGYATVFRNTQGGAEVEYRYGKVTRGSLFRSTSASGTIVPLTTVDVRSKAGGQIVRLAVEEGTVVGKGDLIALIDPRDTRTTVEQAQADLQGANARVDQARTNQQLTRQNNELAVRDARNRLEQAELQLKTAQENAKTEPITVDAALSNAQASLRAAEEAMRQLREVDLPQRRRDSETTLNRAQTAYDTAKQELERQTELHELGYSSAATLQQAKNSEQNALSTLRVAQQRAATLDAELDSLIRTQQTRVDQAKASLRQAEANLSRKNTIQQDLARAEKSVEQARISLQQAESNRLNNQIRQSDVASAQASAVRSRVSVTNAQEQLQETTVVAPRAGVITQKLLEEGTIIPPGASAFSEGTAIVQIADVTKLFVDVPVDESDIASVKMAQPVRIIVEGFPGRAFRGVVTKIFPSATSNNAISTIRVRVEIQKEEEGSGQRGQRGQGGPGGGAPGAATAGGPGAGAAGGRAPGSATSRQAERGQRQPGQGGGTAGGGQRPQGAAGGGPQIQGSASPQGGQGSAQGVASARTAPASRGFSLSTLNPLAELLKVGMNATCEFIQLELKDVLLVPQQAVKREGEETYVMIKTSDPLKPEKRVVTLGQTGNEGTQVLEGLEEGDEVVIAEIDLRDLRERQERIQQQQEGGGFTGGTGR
ncbi:MAG: HlyD family efflux transporter periplasmic adaptor subunit [Fimbriimonadaceae bacterium]|nr:HlyD family efflux transporter periplasmic adaptor subunit [Fimbriimonadaceae bacterium]